MPWPENPHQASPSQVQAILGEMAERIQRLPERDQNFLASKLQDLSNLLDADPSRAAKEKSPEFKNIFDIHTASREEALAMLRETRVSALQMEAILNGLLTAVLVFSTDGTVKLANPAAVAMLGFDPIRMTRAMLYHRLDIYDDQNQPVTEVNAPSTRAAGGEVVINQPLHFVNHQKRAYHILVSSMPIFIGKEFQGTVAVWNNVTDMEKLNRQLQAEREREHARANEMKAVMDATPAYIWLTRDPLARLMEGNQATYDLVRAQPGTNISKTALEASISRNFRAFRDRQEISPAELPVQIAARTGQPVLNYEFDMVFDDGSSIHLFGNAAPLLDETGGPAGAVGAFIDITDRERAEGALRESERQFRLLADAMPQLVWTARNDGAIDYYNQRVNEYSGLEPGADGSWNWHAVLHPDDEADTMDTLKRCMESGETYQVEHRLHMVDGSYRWHLTRALPARDEEGRVTCWYGTSTDIDEMKRVEEALIESQKRFRGVLENSLDAAYRRNLQTDCYDYLSPVVTQILGFTVDEMNKMNFAEVMERVHPEDQQAVEQGMAEAETTGQARIEYRFLNKEGQYRWVADYVTVQKAPDGKPLYRSGMLRDITGRKEDEEAIQRTMLDLERSNSDLEQFAFFASHDLQEPLRKVKMFGDLLKQRSSADLDESSQDYLDRMVEAARRMQEMIEGLLSYSRVSTSNRPFSPTDLNEVLSEVLSDLEIRLQQVQGTVEAGPLPTLQADPIQIRQLLQNLIGNALKFHRTDVPPLVKVWSEAASGRKSGLVRLYVQDNGIGFEEDQMDKVFQPFVRLHGRSAFEGHGIGLAICRKIAERHGGSITARSKPNEGTTFIVTLPLEQK